MRKCFGLDRVRAQLSSAAPSRALLAGAAVNVDAGSTKVIDLTACRGRVGGRDLVSQRTSAVGPVLVGGALAVARPVPVVRRVTPDRIVGETDASSHRLDTAEGEAGGAAGTWSGILGLGWPGACGAPRLCVEQRAGIATVRESGVHTGVVAGASGRHLVADACRRQRQKPDQHGDAPGMHVLVHRPPPPPASSLSVPGRSIVRGRRGASNLGWPARRIW